MLFTSNLGKVAEGPILRATARIGQSGGEINLGALALSAKDVVIVGIKICIAPPVEVAVEVAVAVANDVWPQVVQPGLALGYFGTQIQSGAEDPKRRSRWANQSMASCKRAGLNSGHKSLVKNSSA